MLQTCHISLCSTPQYTGPHASFGYRKDIQTADYRKVKVP